MIVCQCKVVRDDDIRAEVRLGANTVDEVGERCGAGTSCGGCRPAVAAVMDQEVIRGLLAEPARD